MFFINSMKDDQELKHACKFCNKRFHSGRSLGGHMRTHLISSAEPDEKGHYGKKLPPLTSQELDVVVKKIDGSIDSSNIGYSLRENPKKTNKFMKTSEDDTLLSSMICKECGEIFQSWKALFGHMKCHSEKVANNLGGDSWDCSGQKEITDNHSDNEASAMNRKKRSRRVKKISENLNVLNASSSSTCVSDIDQEPEEAAMSLLLLSRDAANTRNSPRIKTSEAQAMDISDSHNGFELSTEKYEINKEGDKIEKRGKPRNENSSKRKCINLHDPFLDEKNTRKQGNSESEIEISESFDRRNSFECVSCNKLFHSFQALGGHRASHKRIKGCFASKFDFSENSTETEHSPNQTVGSSKMIKCLKEKSETDHETKKTIKVHECPICFKVFSSGQALGGHKRTHLIVEAKSNQSIVIQKPSKEERDFLDLNFPPPDEEESNELVGFHKWWMQSNSGPIQVQACALEPPKFSKSTIYQFGYRMSHSQCTGCRSATDAKQPESRPASGTGNASKLNKKFKCTD